MAKKKKFNPVITRVKLNPEQAVLTCIGFWTGGAAYIDYGIFSEWGVYLMFDKGTPCLAELFSEPSYWELAFAEPSS